LDLRGGTGVAEEDLSELTPAELEGGLSPIAIHASSKRPRKLWGEGCWWTGLIGGLGWPGDDLERVRVVVGIAANRLLPCNLLRIEFGADVSGLRFVDEGRFQEYHDWASIDVLLNRSSQRSSSRLRMALWLLVAMVEPGRSWPALPLPDRPLV